MRIRQLCLALAVLLAWPSRAGAQAILKVSNATDQVWHLVTLSELRAASAYSWTAATPLGTVAAYGAQRPYASFRVEPHGWLSLMVTPPAGQPLFGWSLVDRDLVNPGEVMVFCTAEPGQGPEAFLARGFTPGPRLIPWPGGFDALGTLVLTLRSYGPAPVHRQALAAPPLPAAPGAGFPLLPEGDAAASSRSPMVPIPLRSHDTGAGLPAAAGAAAAAPMAPAAHPQAEAGPPAAADPGSLPPPGSPAPAAAPPPMASAMTSLTPPGSPFPWAAQAPGHGAQGEVQPWAGNLWPSPLRPQWPTPDAAGAPLLGSPDQSGLGLASPPRRGLDDPFDDGDGHRRVRRRLDLAGEAGAAAAKAGEAPLVPEPHLFITNGTAQGVNLTLGAPDHPLELRTGPQTLRIRAGEHMELQLGPGMLVGIRPSGAMDLCHVEVSPVAGGPRFHFEATSLTLDGLPPLCSVWSEHPDGTISVDLPPWLHWDLGNHLEIGALP